jgi:hypothetical protein
MTPPPNTLLLRKSCFILKGWPTLLWAAAPDVGPTAHPVLKDTQSYTAGSWKSFIAHQSEQLLQTSRDAGVLMVHVGWYNAQCAVIVGTRSQDILIDQLPMRATSSYTST